MTPTNYAAFITTVDTALGSLYLELDLAVTYERYTKIDPMTGGSIKAYGWTGMTPKPRPWFGQRVPYEPAPQTYQVEVIPHELTLQMDKFILMDSDPNAMSIFWTNLPKMARQWRRFPEYEGRDLLEARGQYTGARQNGMDGKAFFGSHPINLYNPTFNNGSALFGGGSYQNDMIGGFTPAGQSTVVGGPFGIASFTTLRAYMKSIPFEDGETAGIIPTLGIFPQTLESEVDFVLKATLLAPPQWGGFVPLTGQVGSADNMLAKLPFEVIINPFLQYTTRWYMLDASHDEKPLKRVVREAPRTIPRIAESDPIVFDWHKQTWGGYDRSCDAWGYSFLMARSG